VGEIGWIGRIRPPLLDRLGGFCYDELRVARTTASGSFEKLRFFLKDKRAAGRSKPANIRDTRSRVTAEIQQITSKNNYGGRGVLAQLSSLFLLRLYQSACCADSRQSNYKRRNIAFCDN
jgi:hypothetical protein